MVIAAIALVLLLPLLIALYAIVRMTDNGSGFFGQPRRGFGGSDFLCWKFRSMVVDGDAVLARHLASDPDAAREWAETHKLRDDPRVTRIGRFLRKTSLDELPQLLNVLKGEMSLVGPRPIVHAEAVRYGLSYRHYIATRPGITGLWQVSGRSGTTYAHRILLDRKYATQWSLKKDLWILAMTVPAVLLQRGSC